MKRGLFFSPGNWHHIKIAHENRDHNQAEHLMTHDTMDMSLNVPTRHLIENDI
jgi:hypothetical protein